MIEVISLFMQVTRGSKVAIRTTKGFRATLLYRWIVKSFMWFKRLLLRVFLFRNAT
jgi:hypothetical protein